MTKVKNNESKKENKTMNDPIAYKTSKQNDYLIVEHYLPEFPNSTLADDHDDKVGKFDIIIGEKKIDTKYFSSLYYEVDKHLHSDATHMWYILKGTDHSKTYLIDKNALNSICNDISGNPSVEFSIGPNSGQRLAEFTLDMLSPTDYEVIDLSKLNLQ